MSTVYTPATLAERWGCSRAHIYALIETGQLATFRLGRTGRGIRIRGEVVEQWERNGGNTQSADTGLASSTASPSSGGRTRKARTAEDWAASVK